MLEADPIVFLTNLATHSSVGFNGSGGLEGKFNEINPLSGLIDDSSRCPELASKIIFVTFDINLENIIVDAARLP
jgi:hypothetical protein